MNILSWKFVDNFLLGIATNYFNIALEYLFKQKSSEICAKNSLPGPTFEIFASMTMTEVKFEGVPWPQNKRHWSENW